MSQILKIIMKIIQKRANPIFNNKIPLFLSLNIQSLQSKFFELSTFANILQNRQILFDIIGLQEVWSIGSYIDSLDIPGFQRLIFRSPWKPINRNKPNNFTS